jgi:hypothetical protein
MMEHTVFALLLRDFGERKEGLKEFLASGGAKDYETYCRAVGEYSALQGAENTVKDLEKRFIED